MSKVAGINPMYLSGESDKPGSFTVKSLKYFLDLHKIKIGIDENSHIDGVDADSDEPDFFTLISSDPSTVEISDTELASLLQALMIRASFNGNAAERLADIKSILVR